MLNPLLIQMLGLNEKEKSVFDAVINLKVALPVTGIARRAKLPRMTTHDILLKFEKRGIITRIPEMGRDKNYWIFNKKIYKYFP